MPDGRLTHLADRGTLRNPDVLEAEVRRMLTDPKSAALVENFGGQWLQFRALESVAPDLRLEDLGVPQQALVRHQPQLLVGHARPEEVREP